MKVAARRPAPRNARLRVMVVDDHAPVRSAIRQSIEGPDIEVVSEASGGQEAIDRALDERPDLMLIDIDMPGMSGIETVRALAARLPATELVMLTVSDAKADLVEAIQAGANGYLVKGLAPGALRRAVLGAARGDLAMPRHMAAHVVREFAGSTAPRAGEDPRLSLLSPRETDVLALLARGMTDREMAEVLVVSPRTVETHVGNILRKLGARNRAAATRVYLGR
jgi:DNA-binding NarL/FixJ family response regulator